jgi:hypothetical protein
MASTTSITQDRHAPLRAHAVSLAADLTIYDRTEAVFVIAYTLQIVVDCWDTIEDDEVPIYNRRHAH